MMIKEPLLENQYQHQHQHQQHNRNNHNYYLELNEEGQPNITSNKIYSVEMNSIITLHLYNGSPISHKVMLISNVYHPFPSPWYLDTLIGKDIDLSKEKAYLKYPSITNTSIYFILQTQKPGITSLALVYYNEKDSQYKMTQPFTILTEPQLLLNGSEGNIVPLNLQSIRLQTVLTKNLGKLNQFEAYYKECYLLKYNMIHFTTFQELSQIDSVYTIKDQLKISDSFFEVPLLTKESKIHQLKQSLSLLHKKYSIGSVIDIILNQTSNESEWVTTQHTECGCNLVNCPWLNVAYELDLILTNYSNRFYDKKVGCKSAPYINNEQELSEAMIEITKEINRSNLEEFFMIPIERYYDEFRSFYSKYKDNAQAYAMKRSYLFNELKDHPNITYENSNKSQSQSGNSGNKPVLSNESLYDLIYHSCSQYGESRYGVNIEVEFVSIVLIETLTNRNQALNEYDFLKEVKEYINRINDDWANKAASMLSVSIENIRESIKYEFIELKRIGIKKQLIETYFTVFEPDDKSMIFACNGWLFAIDESSILQPNGMHFNPKADITQYDQWYYLKRKLMIWPGTIKLNYGDSIKNCPEYLIEYMTQYITQMASLFDGFMIDSIESIPIFALQILMQAACEVNPNLILISKLIDGTREDEVRYITKVGINLFTRELITSSSIEDIRDNLLSYGQGKDSIKICPNTSQYSISSTEINYNLTKLTMTPYSPLLPKDPAIILFDLTNDNETYYERFNNLSLNLSMMACLALSNCAIGSTRGFDQLFPYQPSISQENRIYAYDTEFESMLKEIQYQSSQSQKRKEVFFEFHPRNCVNPLTKTVRLALSPNWIPDISLTKINDNLFTAKVELQKGKYMYKYVLDGNIWTIDPLKPMENDTGNNANNVLDLCDETKLIVPDLKMLRQDLNAIRADCIHRDSEVYVHVDSELIAVMRLFKPGDINEELDYDGYGVICRPGFDSNKRSIASKIVIPGEISDFISGCYMITSNYDMNQIRSEPLLSGFKGNAYYTKDLKFLSSISTISVVQGQTLIEFHSILPNTVVLFKIRLSDMVRFAVNRLNEALRYMERSQENSNLIDNEDVNIGIGNDNGVDIGDINHALFKCDKEEIDCSSNKRGIYRIDKSSANANTLVYAGLAQLYQLISEYNIKEDMNNPIYNNIKEGDWLIDFTLSRIRELQSFKHLTKYIEDNVIKHYTKLYPHLKPFYFSKLIEVIYHSIIKQIYTKMPPLLVNYGDFSQRIILASYEFIGHVISSTFTKQSNPIKTQKIINDKGMILSQSLNPQSINMSLSAGLPHYSIEYYRCFGRETFMSFKGLLLLNKHFPQAKSIIKTYASTLRHGMIPNQLGNGSNPNPRYNARDCPWLFIQSIKDYIAFTKDYNILKEEIDMIFLSDNMDLHLKSKAKGETKSMSLSDIIQEIFQCHALGIDYSEWKPGNDSSIEHHVLSYEGSNMKIYLDAKTGFVYGGNKHNAGTWMNKIGTSDRARNKGKAATPRNGAAIEIIALLYSALDFVIKMNELGYYKHKGVTLNNGANYPYSQWRLLLNDNFEDMFYLSRKSAYNKEGIYKDYLSNSNSNDSNSNRVNECQLRPNYLMAMVYAPELFKKHNAIRAIDNAEKYLLTNMGIRSLDYEDQSYCGILSLYETGSYETSNGFNLHNGPEYVWLIGYYLLAKLNFNAYENKSDFLHYASRVLIPLMKYIKKSHWIGLPDYTGENGKECESACGTYSISIAVMLEVLNIMASFIE